MRSILMMAGLGLCACGKDKGAGGSSGSAASYQQAKVDIAKVAVQKFAAEAYPQWSAQHAGTACPGTLQELAQYMNTDSLADPWGNPYAMMCGDQAPADAHGFGVISYGPDGKSGGGDDITSWSK
jgi:hypothetical protein